MPSAPAHQPGTRQRRTPLGFLRRSGPWLGAIVALGWVSPSEASFEFSRRRWDSMTEFLTLARSTLGAERVVLGAKLNWESLTEADAVLIIHPEVRVQFGEASAFLSAGGRLAISSAADNSGTLSLLMPSGDTYVWDHNAITKEVAFGIDTASSLLAYDIEELNFRAANVDGSTQVTEVGLIHSILCTVKFNLARLAGNELITVSSQAWLRAW